MLKFWKLSDGSFLADWNGEYYARAQEAQGLADLPAELGGSSVRSGLQTTTRTAFSKKPEDQVSSQDGTRRAGNLGSAAKSSAQQRSTGDEQAVADTANVAAISLLETSQMQAVVDSRNISAETAAYKDINLKKTRAGRQNQAVSTEEWRRRQSEVVKACKVNILLSHQSLCHP